MHSSSRIFAPLLALMMVGDARAAMPKAKFTTRNALKGAVDACLDISSPGNCCLPWDNEDSTTGIKEGTGGDQEGICAMGFTHLKSWDVSEVTDMQKSELSLDLLPLPFVCCALSFKVVCSCDLTLSLLLCLFCVFLPLVLMYSVSERNCF
jgi:hypothetical protein